MVIMWCSLTVTYITHIIKASMGHDLFPKIWETARVWSLLKIKIRTDFGDLRPMNNKTSKRYVAKSNNIWKALLGCTTALPSVTNDIMAATYNCNLALLVLLDYSKALEKEIRNWSSRFLINFLNFRGYQFPIDACYTRAHCIIYFP